MILCIESGRRLSRDCQLGLLGSLVAKILEAMKEADQHHQKMGLSRLSSPIDSRNSSFYLLSP